MNKKDREQLEIFNKKIDYLVKESSKQSMATFIGIAVAYFAIATSGLFSPYIYLGSTILILGSYTAGVIFLILALREGWIWKKKYDEYLKEK